MTDEKRPYDLGKEIILIRSKLKAIEKWGEENDGEYLDMQDWKGFWKILGVTHKQRNP